MVRIRELIELARQLDTADFAARLGPIALMQRPAAEARPFDQRALLVKTWSMLNRATLAAPVDFGDLLIATLPPTAADGTMKLLIGRNPQSDLVLEDLGVSSRHAELRWDGTAAQLVDLDSSNGTFINGQPLAKATTLESGDHLGFGVSHFIFMLAPQLHQRILRNYPA